ncbi:MAG: hypothetical protein KC432_15125 [Thermomicrobiales bacterium]|nr:hypothetical protein [Thermomicrobiales bacterium]
MDDRRFDELSKHLSTGLSRKGILRLLGGVGAAGIAATGLLQAADAKKKGKNKKRKKKHKGKTSQQGNTQSQLDVQADSNCGSGKVLICHKAGQSGNYTTNCVSTSAVCQHNGHAGHSGDCICLGSSVNCPNEGTLQTCSSDNVACGGHDGSDLVCTGCGSGKTACGKNCCTSSQKCCNGKCVEKSDLCGGRCDKPCKAGTCETATCDKYGDCQKDPIDGKQGPGCTGEGDICCSGRCVKGDKCGCTPKTCKDVEGKCGDKIPDGCGGTIRCDCPDKECQAATCVGDKCKYTPIDGEQGPECHDKGEICCAGKCVKTDTLCGGTCSNACEDEICQTASCVSGKCKHTPVENGEPGPLCDEEGDFCCNGDCCEAGDVCTGEGCCTPKTCAVDYAGQCGTFPQGCGLEDVTCECTSGHTCNPQGICVDIPSCVPVSIEEACSGLHCGPASNGCGVDYECGTCGKKKKKGQRPIKQGCVAGVCKPFKKKRCFGSGLAGQKCSNKCKCKNGRKCNNGRCCEDVGDGSRHCNSNSECCPGLVCAYRRPGQHRVCMPRNAKDLSTESTETTAAPGVAIGAILTGLAATMGAKLTGNGEPASVAMDEVQIHALGPRD